MSPAYSTSPVDSMLPKDSMSPEDWHSSADIKIILQSISDGRLNLFNMLGSEGVLQLEHLLQSQVKTTEADWIKQLFRFASSKGLVSAA